MQLATAAAEAGGKVLREKFNASISIRSKAPADMVTEADLAAEKAIVDLIQESYPRHSVLAEESHVAKVDSEHLWVIDPLDGTTNFVHGVPHVAVSIAYYQSGKPIAGVVYNPIHEDWFTVERGAGAFANGQAAKVSNSPLNESLIGVGFYYDRGAMMRATLSAVQELFEQQIHGIRRMGTAALDLCSVGTGQFGAFFEYQLSPWDFAAGRLFIEEAGGIITTCNGDELPLAKTTILAAGPSLHEAILPIVARNLPPE